MFRYKWGLYQPFDGLLEWSAGRDVCFARKRVVGSPDGWLLVGWLPVDPPRGGQTVLSFRQTTAAATQFHFPNKIILFVQDMRKSNLVTPNLYYTLMQEHSLFL